MVSLIPENIHVYIYIYIYIYIDNSFVSIPLARTSGQGVTI